MVQKLISDMQITKAIFTMDALHCQKKTVEEVINSDNDYIITVKKNQPTLHKAITEKAKTKPLDSYSWEQKGYGHDTRCRIRIWEADSNMKEKWYGLERYITVQRTGIRDGKEFNVTTNYISSAKQISWCFANEIRGHRKIENSLHWTKDVVQNEDNCGLSETKGAVNKYLNRIVCNSFIG